MPAGAASPPASTSASTPTSGGLRRPLTAVPPGIHCAEDYERAAAACLDEATFAYVAGGSERGLTVDFNRAAFAAHAIWPRPFRDVAAGHTRVRLGDNELVHPIVLGPVAFQRSLHPGAEIETARGASATDTLLVLSTLSSVALEDVARAAGTRRWFQLYLQPRRETSLDLAARALHAGYAAIVVTIDAPLQPASHRSLRAGHRLVADEPPANLVGYPLSSPSAANPGASRILNGLMRQAPTWDDIAWLLRHCGLPLWVKGVLHPDDARRLAELGAAGIVVSNHGGRSLDGAPASLAALPSIRDAVGPAFPLLLDGGIRRGSDVFKALALGANAVLVGRLQAYALAVAGALGVAHMVRLLREELEVCMALAGCADPTAITADTLASTGRDGVATFVAPTKRGDISC